MFDSTLSTSYLLNESSREKPCMKLTSLCKNLIRRIDSLLICFIRLSCVIDLRESDFYCTPLMRKLIRITSGYVLHILSIIWLNYRCGETWPRNAFIHLFYNRFPCCCLLFCLAFPVIRFTNKRNANSLRTILTPYTQQGLDFTNLFDTSGPHKGLDIR